jgi:hypothetical protein
LTFGKVTTSADHQVLAKTLGYEQQIADPDADLTFAKVDLNGDGITDYVVRLEGSAFCGTLGCSTTIHMSQGSGYISALDVVTQDVSVEKTSTKGVCNLSLESRWIWNGKTYEVVRHR